MPKGRARVVRGRSGRTHAFTPAKTRDYEWLVTLGARSAMNQFGREHFPWPGPLVVTLAFGLERTRSVPRSRTHPTVKPALDNLEKAILDGLTKAGLWQDDAQVVQKSSLKYYGTPGVKIIVEKLDSVEVWA